MWNEINTTVDVHKFMDAICSFHDSCIKELRYLSGAYVNDDLGMHPVNDRRILRVLIQRQCKDPSMIEMEFEGLKHLKLFPIDEQYTCEIIAATIILKDDRIYWCDCGGLSETDLASYGGTVICAAKLRWRMIENALGPNAFYESKI